MVDRILLKITERAEQRIPIDFDHTKTNGDYSRWYIIWFETAIKIRDEFIAEGLVESAKATQQIINDNLGILTKIESEKVMEALKDAIKMVDTV